MNDPIDEIFNGTPDGIDVDERIQMQQAEQARQRQIAQDMQTQESPTAGTTGSAEETQQPTQQQTEAKVKEEGQQGSPYMNEDGELDLEKMRKHGEEFDTFSLRGLQDFAVDTVNFFTAGSLGLKKAPKFENETAQSVRELSSVLLPLAASGGLAGSLQGVGASRYKILADKGFQRLATFGFNTGAGVFVDTVSETSEGDNVTGMLKQNFPRTWGWIPDDIATLSEDSPDVKKKKNISEGFGLGMFTDLIGPISKLLRNKRGLKAARYVPEAEKTNQFFKGASSKLDTNFTDDVAANVTRRSDALDELGQFNMSKPFAGDQPMLGVQDMYGYAEEGIRSVDDMGIVAARVDNARILNNIDTVDGRLGSVVSEGAIKFALEGSAEYGQVTKMLGDQITAAGRYGYITDTGKNISAKTIDKASDDLMELLDMTRKGDLQRIIDKMPKRELKGELYKAFDELVNFDQLQADAMLQTSLAGQVSDMSEGLRLLGANGSAQRGMEQILDRIELLMVANSEKRVKKGLLQRFKDFRIGEQGLEDALQLKTEGLKVAKRQAKEAVDTMRSLKNEAPEFLEPLFSVYEMTNGNVTTMAALNDYFQASTGTLSKALINRTPDVDSVVMRGAWSTVYNNAMMALGTPLKALASNMALTLERPMATFAGAMMAGDGYTLRRGLFQAQNMYTTLRNSFEYMGDVFKKSGLDPDYAPQLGRESQLLKNSKQIDALNDIAEAYAERGEYGAMAIMEQVEALNDVAESPLLRLGNRSLMALDGFLNAFNGVVEARGRAFDMVNQGKVTADQIEQVAKQSYEEMFQPDELGRMIISDKAVNIASGEIAMNLDNPATEALSELIRRVPGIRPAMMFTRTPVNALAFGLSHTPAAKFMGDFYDFSRRFDEVPENELVKILESRGIPYDENAQIAYNQIRAELKGRKAIGSLAVMGAVGLFMNDGITGDGIDNVQTMKERRKNGWKPRSFKSPIGYVSYDGIPGVSDILATVSNIMDNMTSLEGTNVSELLNATGFIIASSLTERSGLTNMETLFKVLKGDTGAVNRWAASFIPSATTPGANGLLELQKLVVPQLKVVGDNIGSMILNRSLVKSTLPDQYDYIDGGIIGEPPNFLTRIFNVYSPFKVSGLPSPEKQFLIDIEYDGRSNFDTDGQGVELNSNEQSMIAQRMGQNKTLKRELQRIMKTTSGKQFREAVRAAQAKGVQVDIRKFQMLQLEIDRAFNLAKEEAIYQVDQELGGAISDRRFNQDSEAYFQQTGDVDAILSIPK